VYTVLKGLVLALFKAPQEPPPPPAGAHGSVEVFRASPKYLTYRLLGLMIGAMAVVAVTLGFAIGGLVHDPELFIGAALAVVFGGGAISLAYFLIHLDYDLRYYVFTDRSLRVREGAWTVQEKTLTYANVQNLHLHQGPLQRLFGIRDLRVDTAGGGGAMKDGKTMGKGHNVTVAGVENARELRDRVLAHMRTAGRGSGLGDPDDEIGGGDLADPAVLEALRAVAAEARALRQAVPSEA
jgi:membrane protein YdbS with pleckstrin-like domain